MGEVAFKRLLLVQIDVEHHKIDPVGAEVFRRGKVSKSDEAMRICTFGHADEFIEETARPCRALPAHDIGWNLIRDAEREHGRMFTTLPDCIANRRSGFLLSLLGVQETTGLPPGNIDQEL